MIKIYKLTSPQTDRCYIGSTKQKYLSDRVSSHRVQYRRFINKKDKLYCSSFEIVQYEDMKYELIEETDDIRKESFHILNNNSCNIKNIYKN